jgi:hypothetical protein
MHPDMRTQGYKTIDLPNCASRAFVTRPHIGVVPQGAIGAWRARQRARRVYTGKQPEVAPRLVEVLKGCVRARNV